MIKYLTVPLLCLLVLGLLSCASYDKQLMGQVEKAALVSVYADKRVNMNDFGGLAAMVSKLVQDEKFRLVPIVTAVKDRVLKEYSKNMPFEFLPEDDVIKKEGYINLEGMDTGLSLKHFLSVPPGYLGLGYLNQTAFVIPDADAMVYVWTNFMLKKEFEILGVGTAKVRATVTLAVKNRDGKELMSIFQIGESDGVIVFALGGVFDATELLPLCDEAAKAAAAHMTDWLRNTFQN